MTQPETQIRSAWRHIAGPHHDGYIDDVLVRYAEPHRHYHTATHVMFVLRHVRDIAHAGGAAPSPAVIAAALYHDAIYEPAAHDNEGASAVLAVHDLGEIGWARDECEKVAGLIIATAGHVADDAVTVGRGEGGEGPQRSDTGDVAMLLDADLAVLGADPAMYQAYVNGVRAEYAHVSDEQWRIGRRDVLVRFLGRDRLYRTSHMHETFDRRARANIEAELATLRDG
ncbi:MAG TPA: hypothetical protein VGC84_11310 [Ilumatobacteraceae bacterium]|jgi:predicted metal-dependent HD superfamily phosphohydrolase